MQFVTNAQILYVENINFWGYIFALNIRCFAKKSAVVEFYGLLVTHLGAHRFTLCNPILVIPMIYLLRVI